MQGESTQPTRISKEEYIKFKQWVQDVHGTTRGHLSTEIENALREYRQPDNQQDRLARIENDLATIKANVATAQTDGGSVADSNQDPNTHAHADKGKPNHNAPRSEKVDWLISEYYNRDGGETHPNAIKTQLKEAFSFGDRTAEKYVDLVIDELGAKPHPIATNDLHAWGDSLERAKEKRKEQAEKEAENEMDKLE